MPAYLRNVWVSGIFPEYLGIWEISQIPRHLRNFQNLKNIPPSNIYRNLEFPKCLGIWEISQISGKFPGFSMFGILLRLESLTWSCKLNNSLGCGWDWNDLCSGLLSRTSPIATSFTFLRSCLRDISRMLASIAY